MLSVRKYRPEELSWIVQRAAETAWAQLVARDLADASPDGVRAQTQRMYQLALSAPGGEILVADWPAGCHEPGPAAYALLMPQPNAFTGRGEVIVLDIYTDPRLRGRRVGATLLQHAEQFAWAAGCSTLVAQVALHNRSSLQLFQRFGYAPERLVLGKRCQDPG